MKNTNNLALVIRDLIQMMCYKMYNLFGDLIPIVKISQSVNLLFDAPLFNNHNAATA